MTTYRNGNYCYGCALLHLDLKMSSDISALTWECIELQNLIEDPTKSETEKNELIDRHLTLLSERDPVYFPEFDSGNQSM